MIHSKPEKVLEKIKNVYISSEAFWQVNTQSCDCIELIIDTGEKMISLRHCKFDEGGCIKLDEFFEYSKEEYNHKVSLYNEEFFLETIKYFHNGFIEVIKFKHHNVFLFIFALEDNLVLTKSKYDLLDETTNNFPEVEVTLEIEKNI